MDSRDTPLGNEVRTTATSAAEGRLKVGVGGRYRAKKRDKLKSMVKDFKDGSGGPGYCSMHGKYDGHGGPGLLPSPANPNPVTGPSPIVTQGGSPSPLAPAAAPSSMMPPMGTQITPNSFTPQQQMAMSQMGMSPMGAGAGSATPAVNSLMHPGAKMANRSHHSMRTSGIGHIKSLGRKTTVKGIMASMKSKKSRAPVF